MFDSFLIRIQVFWSVSHNHRIFISIHALLHTVGWTVDGNMGWQFQPFQMFTSKGSGTESQGPTCLPCKWCDTQIIHQIWSVHFEILDELFNVENTCQSKRSKPCQKKTHKNALNHPAFHLPIPSQPLQGGNRWHEWRSHTTLEQCHGLVGVS